MRGESIVVVFGTACQKLPIPWILEQNFFAVLNYFVHSTNLLGYLGYSCLELVSLINKMYVVCETLAPYLF